MKRLLACFLCAAAAMSLSTECFAMDYKFSTVPETDYYKSTGYEDRFDSRYQYGGINQSDYEIPDIRYGLSHQFPYDPGSGPVLTVPSGSGGGAVPQIPVVPGTPGGGVIEIPYQPDVTLAAMQRSDGSIGTVRCRRVGLYAKAYEGVTDANMSKGAGHYPGTALWNGNIALFGHNRGTGVDHFAELKDVLVGDTISYNTTQGTRSYKVDYVGIIASNDFSRLNETGENTITLTTCIRNQPSLRLCVQAKEIR